MKVILKKDVPRLGPKNTVMEVSDSYAMNVLLKQGLADRVTKDLENKILKQKDEKLEAIKMKSSKHLQTLVELKAIASQNKERSGVATLFALTRNADSKGHLYGAITEAEIVDGVFETVKVSLNPKQVYFPVPVKNKGIHAFIIKGNNGETEMKFEFEVR